MVPDNSGTIFLFRPRVIRVQFRERLQNLKRPDDTWKVRLIEEEFRRLMFDVKDV